MRNSLISIGLLLISLFFALGVGVRSRNVLERETSHESSHSVAALERLVKLGKNDQTEVVAGPPEADELKQQADAFVKRTTLNQRRQLLIDESGDVKIRIQIPSLDLQSMLCVARADEPIPHLTVTKCGYSDDQFFLYSPKQGTLRSASNPDEGIWVPSSDVSYEFKKKFRGRLPFVLSDTEDPVGKWKFSVPSTAKLVFKIPQARFGGYCMQTMSNGLRVSLLAKKTWGDTSQCASLHVLTTDDDEIKGPIVQFSLNPTTGRLTEQCATYDSTAVAPQSAFILKPCDASDVNQQFVYNLITKHLRSLATPEKAGVFFWWRGPLKLVPDLDPSDEGYGWNLPIRRPGSVLAVDERGYSGACWSEEDDRVIAGQTCGTYSMMPTEDCFLYRLVNRELKYESVHITSTFVSGDGSVRSCLSLGRLQQALDGEATDYRILWRFWWQPCDYSTYRLHQRFVLATDPNTPCDSKSCQGFVRWAGDLNLAMSLWHSNDYMFDEEVLLAGGSIDETDYRFNLPYQTEGPIQICRTSMPDRVGCIKNSYRGYVTHNMSDCMPRISIVPSASLEASESTGNNVSVISRYDFRAFMALPNQNQQNLTEFYLFRTSINELTQDLRDRFDRNYDNFIGDLGVTGTRRLRALGSGLHPQPGGQIRANTDPAVPNGVTLPLAYDYIRPHKYVSIDVLFQVDRVRLGKRPQNSYLLMSFARGSGCVVFVTFRGKLGIRCYAGGEEIAFEQVLNWRYSLLDGIFHKLTVAFPTRGPTGFIHLYLDGDLLFRLPRHTQWSLADTGETVSLFYDPYFWQYAPLPASLARASVIGSGNFSQLQEIALQHIVLSNYLVVKNSNVMRVGSSFSTVWRNCRLIPGTGVHYEGLQCTIEARRNNTAVRVPSDVFSLGCSRPGCSITFLPNQPFSATHYDFMYRPNYPDSFASENVGNPDLFQDPAYITDGFTTRTISIGLKFTPQGLVGGGSHLETSGSALVAVLDPVTYMCVQSCCGYLGDQSLRVVSTDNTLQAAAAAPDATIF